MREIERKDERPDTMTAGDRDKINEFSRLLVRRSELEAKVKSREEILRVHDDAADELILLDDDQEVQHAIGDVFLVDTAESVGGIVDEARDDLKREINEANEEMKTISKRLSQLKSTLYAKFGNAINLEES